MAIDGNDSDSSAYKIDCRRYWIEATIWRIKNWLKQQAWSFYYSFSIFVPTFFLFSFSMINIHQFEKRLCISLPLQHVFLGVPLKSGYLNSPTVRKRENRCWRRFKLVKTADIGAWIFMCSLLHRSCLLSKANACEWLRRLAVWQREGEVSGHIAPMIQCIFAKAQTY